MAITGNLNLNLVLPVARPMACPPRAPTSLLARGRGASSSPSLLVTRAIDVNEFLGDFGNTEHKILIPTITALALSQQECAPVSPSQPPISLDDAQTLIRKVVGWRLVNEEGGLKIQCLWKLRDFKCGVELINRISKVVEALGHFPNIYLEQPNQVRAELWTASIGGLTMNDFIVAAKIDEIKTSDLVPRKRVWA
ncbi:Putative pterin-4-alpha-carbinolamine dehydratase [Glycine soja]|uniref:4a-hydroxytetrahydrobiopterin dehydratase n=1 Tax=Glycine soja TaxID=3848 RepID=A0A0B2SQX2_GLYSO|nr:Putative pterin-4-alpha-carbinolamine dehydratase [Glycine soja]